MPFISEPRIFVSKKGGISFTARWILTGLVMLTLTSCATQRYGRLTPLSPGERASLTCKQIIDEIEKAEYFLADIRRQRNETTGAHVLGALGDFGIGNVMEGDAAEKSGTDRLDELKVLQGGKGCKSSGAATSSPVKVGKRLEPKSPGKNVTPAAIPDGDLSGDQIKKALDGKIVENFTPSGRWTLSSVHFRANGKLSGERNNPTSFNEDEGEWSIGGGQKLCTRWDNWFYASRECFRVQKRGKQLLLFDSTARLTHTYTIQN